MIIELIKVEIMGLTEIYIGLVAILNIMLWLDKDLRSEESIIIFQPWKLLDIAINKIKKNK